MISLSLAGKTAVVTGGSRGIGAACAVALGEAGANVVVVYNSNAGEADKVVATVEAAGAKAVAVRADVGEPAAAPSVFDAGKRAFGKVDILLLSAGAILNKTIADTTDADFDKLMRLNVYGTFYFVREAARRLADHGRLITFSSSTTKMLLPTYGPYVATKGAVEQLTRVAGKELGARKICVNAISPGATATELFLKDKTKEQIDRTVSMTSFGRLGEVGDMTGLVVFLCSDAAAWITGQNIPCNGGSA